LSAASLCEKHGVLVYEGECPDCRSDAAFARVRYSRTGPWQAVDRAGFDEWVENMRKGGNGSAMRIDNVMWCACGCGIPVWPEDYAVPEGANGTNVYYVDGSHFDRVKAST
jgi:hypothetical protein